MFIHTGDKSSTCDTCSECFFSFIWHEAHMRIHFGDNPYTCDTCGKCFLNHKA